MKLTVALLTFACATAAQAQRMQPGDICDYGVWNYDQICPPQGANPGPWIGRRVEVLAVSSWASANVPPECAGRFAGIALVQPAYGSGSVWVDKRLVANCVDRNVAPETVERHRQAVAHAQAEKQAAAAREAAQAPIDERGGQLIHLSHDYMYEIGRRLNLYLRGPHCAQVREIYQTAQYRVRVVCGTPGGPLDPHAYVVHMNFTNGAQEFRVLRAVKRH